MAQINVHNYEAFLLDYFEGRLNEENIQALKTFAAKHPELNIDLDDNDLAHLPVLDNDVVFEEKTTLKKNTMVADDELAFEYVEGLLDEEAKHRFEIELSKNPDLAKTLTTYQKTILSADPSVVFALKSELYKFEDDAAEVFDYTEDCMSAEARMVFEQKLKSSTELQKQVTAYRQTKLQADKSILFADKKSLKHNEATIIPLFNWRYVSGIAAGLALVVGLYAFFKSDAPVQNNLATKKDSVQIQQKITPQQNEIQVKNNELAAQKENVTKGKTTPKRVKKGSIIRQLNKDTSESALANATKTKDKKVKGSIIRQLGKDTTTVGLANVAKAKDKKIKGNIIRQFGKDTTNTQLANTPKKVPAAPTLSVTPANTDLASAAGKEKTTRLSFIPEGVDTDEDSTAIKTAEIKKKGFWSRALKTAGQLNTLGLKTINGNEGENSDVLSLSKVSVELKKSR